MPNTDYVYEYAGVAYTRYVHRGFCSVERNSDGLRIGEIGEIETYDDNPSPTGEYEVHVLVSGTTASDSEWRKLPATTRSLDFATGLIIATYATTTANV